MKILDEETVVRYHVEYDARLWSTQIEIDETSKLLTQAKEGCS